MKGLKVRHTKTMRKIAGRWSQCDFSARRSCHGLDVLDGFHPSDRRGQGPLAFHPRDGHLARHRPVAGLQLDVFCLGMNFPENRIPLFGGLHAMQANEMRLHLESHDQIEQPEAGFPDHAQERAQGARVN
jgi:hypothetical protein